MHFNSCSISPISYSSDIDSTSTNSHIRLAKLRSNADSYLIWFYTPSYFYIPYYSPFTNILVPTSDTQIFLSLIGECITQLHLQARSLKAFMISHTQYLNNLGYDKIWISPTAFTMFIPFNISKKQTYSLGSSSKPRQLMKYLL